MVAATNVVVALVAMPVKGSALFQLLDRAVLIAKIAEVHATLTVATLAIVPNHPVGLAKVEGRVLQQSRNTR